MCSEGPCSSVQVEYPLINDVPRLSPLCFAHINVLGRYYFEVNADVAAGMLRPLRDLDFTDAFETAWDER